MTNKLYYGDNLEVLRNEIADASIDLVYLDPPYNSNAGYKLLFKSASGAAVLIGLIFVVITLMQDRSRDSVLAGSKLYTGPIVLGVSLVLAPSAAALVPGIHGVFPSAAYAALGAAALAFWPDWP